MAQTIPGEQELARRKRTFRSRPLVRRLGFVLAVCVGVWLVFCGIIAYGFVHPPHLPPRATPQEYNLTAEDVSFPTTSGLTLRGWLIPAKLEGGQNPRGVIVLCHGRQGSRSDMLQHAVYLREAGFACLTFSFRGCGDSPGNLSTIGYREAEDVESAVKYVQSRAELAHLPVGVMGSSMGAAAVLLASARNPDIRAVVADSPYARLERAIDQRFRGIMGPISPAFSVPVQFLGERMAGFRARNVAPIKVVAKIAPRPLFLIHGEDDILIRAEDSRMLYQAAGNPKTLWIIAGAGHVYGHVQEPKEYERRVTDFFTRALTPLPKPKSPPVIRPAGL